MLENYTPTSNPNNLSESFTHPYLNSIIIGASSTQKFHFDFKFSTNASSFKIMYKQGPEIILEKTNQNCTISEGADYTDVTLELSSTDTKKFTNLFLDSLVQIKVFKNNSIIYYNDIQKIPVSVTLDYGVPENN